MCRQPLFTLLYHSRSLTIGATAHALICFIYPITEQGNCSGYQGNTENNNGGYGPDCFGNSGSFRPLPLSIGRFTRSVTICRTLVPVAVAHLFVPLIIYYLFSY